MAFKITREGNYFVVRNTDNSQPDKYPGNIHIDISDDNADANTVYTLRWSNGVIDQRIAWGGFSDFLDSNDNPFADNSALETFLDGNANFNLGGGGYGSLNGENQGSGIACTDQSTFYKYNQFDIIGASSNLTVEAGAEQKITISHSGDYDVSLVGDVEGSAGENYQWEIHLNQARTSIGARIHIETLNQPYGIAARGLFTLSSDDEIEAYVRCYTAAGTVARARELHLTVVQVG